MVEDQPRSKCLMSPRRQALLFLISVTNRCRLSKTVKAAPLREENTMKRLLISELISSFFALRALYAPDLPRRTRWKPQATWMSVVAQWA